MSYKHVNWVLAHSPYTRTTRMIHLVLAYRAKKDDGTCFPAIGSIARDCRTSISTVKRAVKRMMLDGYLESDLQGYHRSNLYHVLIGDEVAPVTPHGVAPVTPHGVSFEHDEVSFSKGRGVTHDPHKVSNTIQNPNTNTHPRVSRETYLEYAKQQPGIDNPGAWATAAYRDQYDLSDDGKAGMAGIPDGTDLEAIAAYYGQ